MEACHTGKLSKATLMQALRTLLVTVNTGSFAGDPARDWTFVKRHLRDSNQDVLIAVAGHLDYLVAFNRGKRISGNLVVQWEMTQTYAKAREAVDSALTQDLIVDGMDDPDGVQIMTIHKSKGKQFDGVIVLRGTTFNGTQRASNLVWRGDSFPFRRSRKILMVGVTRARVHTLVP